MYVNLFCAIIFCFSFVVEIVGFILYRKPIFFIFACALFTFAVRSILEFRKRRAQTR